MRLGVGQEAQNQNARGYGLKLGTFKTMVRCEEAQEAWKNAQLDPSIWVATIRY